MLKGIAAHYVMRADDRVALMVRQRELLAELVAVLVDRGPDALERPFADDWHAAADDAARLRVVIDQVASLTDASARHLAPTALLSASSAGHATSGTTPTPSQLVPVTALTERAIGHVQLEVRA